MPTIETTADALLRRYVADRCERERWTRLLAADAGQVRAGYSVQWWTRLNNRSLAYRVASAYFSAPLRRRRILAAIAGRSTAPRYMLADCGQQGAARYATVRPTPTDAADWSPFAYVALAAARMLRRWRWIDAAAD